MKKKVAIVQSNYIPWKGYFDLIAYVDEFILFDDVQYTRRDWRNRNLIKTPNGSHWLSIPVLVKDKYHQKICETNTSSDEWRQNHWKSLTQNYKNAAYFKPVSAWLEDLYLNDNTTNLSKINYSFITTLCKKMNINTKISYSSEYASTGDKSERLARICKAAQAKEYISGPAAKSYLELEPFTQYGINVQWFNYNNYPEYNQLWGAFEHGLSILDLLFNCGDSACDYMRYIKK